MPDAVAGHFTHDGQITINAGEPWVGRAGVAAMAAGFYADIPDLALTCDGIRGAGEQAIYLWTFTGTHVAHGNPVRISGWEEWTVDPVGLVSMSRGWFDAAEYARQAGI